MIDKIANPAAAAGAYANTAQVGMGAANKGGFKEMLGSAILGSIDTMKAGEMMSAKAITGTASLPDVVQAVNAADMNVKTLVAVRDKMVAAYQEMLRMQI